MIGYALLFFLGGTIGWTLACVSIARSIRDDMADLDHERAALDRDRYLLDRERRMLEETIFVRPERKVSLAIGKRDSVLS
jgi:hypothetical protein